MLSILQEELKTAMKAGDKPKMTGLRNIIGKLKVRQIDKGEPLTKQESLKIIQSVAKQLKESIKQFQKGGRDDLVQTETFELSILEQFLPQQISVDKIRLLVKETLQSTKAENIPNLGQVMGIIMKDLAGSADGKLVRQIVREELS